MLHIGKFAINSKYFSIDFPLFPSPKIASSNLWKKKPPCFLHTNLRQYFMFTLLFNMFTEKWQRQAKCSLLETQVKAPLGYQLDLWQI